MHFQSRFWIQIGIPALLGVFLALWWSSNTNNDNDTENFNNDPVDYDQFRWKDLPPHVQDAAKVLGYTSHVGIKERIQILPIGIGTS